MSADTADHSPRGTAGEVDAERTDPVGSGGEPPVPLTEPRDGVPPVVADARAFADTLAAFAAGTGPVAVDAERASGYRYGQRAFLVQLRRAGAGTALIDPVSCPDLFELSAILSDAEWVLHAASQDLPCLAELGFAPRRLFDTELAGRLAGFERVGLGAMVERVLGLTLEKGHSAADWSKRPLPEPWLRYAALDVEVLLELRDELEAELIRQDKLEWAHEEFAAIVSAGPPAARIDPWRRTSGLHRVRSPRKLAAVRELWTLRDELARKRDIAPGRLLPDAAIVGTVLAAPQTVEAVAALPYFTGRSARRLAPAVFTALRTAAALPDSELPRGAGPVDGPPPANRWAERDPVAAARLARLRAVITELAEQHRLPAENLVQPDAVRRLAWDPPREPGAAAVASQLRAVGARSWQISLTAERFAAALQAPPDEHGDPAAATVPGGSASPDTAADTEA